MQTDPDRNLKPEQPAARIEVRWLPVESLDPDARNARLHPAGQIARICDSIAAFGFNVPVLIDGEGRVIAGHARLLAARRLGLAEIPTITLDHLGEARRRAFMIADNRLAEFASWDEKRLGEALRELKRLDLDFAIETTGFESPAIELGLEAPAWLAEPGRRARGPRRRHGPPVARAGDAWALGPHRLVCGEARDETGFRALDAAIRRWQADTGETARLHPAGETFDKVARGRNRAGAARAATTSE